MGEAKSYFKMEDIFMYNLRWDGLDTQFNGVTEIEKL